MMTEPRPSEKKRRPKQGLLSDKDHLYPLASIILPVYNCEKYVSFAIESILSQTYRPIEVIVINDGSTDGTGERLSKFGSTIQVIEQKNKGLSYSLNKGLATATGKYIGFLDADDLWLPQKLSSQVGFLENHPHISMVFGYLQQFISPELDERDRQSFILRQSPEPGYVKITMLARCHIFNQVGFFNESIRVGDFIDWYMRAKDEGLKDHMLLELVAKRRLHKSHSTSRDNESMKSYVHILKAGIDRRKAKSADRPSTESDSER